MNKSAEASWKKVLNLIVNEAIEYQIKEANKDMEKTLPVKDTKNPINRQLFSMATNLRKHFGVHCAVSVEANSFEAIGAGRTEIVYSLYVSSIEKPVNNFKSWKELLKFYHYLMNKKV